MDVLTHENDLIGTPMVESLMLGLVWGPCAVNFLVIVVLVSISLRAPSSCSLLSADVVRDYVSSISVVLLLASIDIEMMALLPWSSQKYAGFPSRRVLCVFMVSALAQKGALLVVSYYLCTVDPSNLMSKWVFGLSIFGLVQLLLEKALVCSTLDGAPGSTPARPAPVGGLHSPASTAITATPSTVRTPPKPTYSHPSRPSPPSCQSYMGDEVPTDEEAEEARRASQEACRAIQRDHLEQFLQANPGATFEAWIAMLHPENVTLDHRMKLPESSWIQMWNELRSVEGVAGSSNRRSNDGTAGMALSKANGVRTVTYTSNAESRVAPTTHLDVDAGASTTSNASSSSMPMPRTDAASAATSFASPATAGMNSLSDDSPLRSPRLSAQASLDWLNLSSSDEEDVGGLSDVVIGTSQYV